MAPAAAHRTAALPSVFFFFSSVSTCVLFLPSSSPSLWHSWRDRFSPPFCGSRGGSNSSAPHEQEKGTKANQWMNTAAKETRRMNEKKRPPKKEEEEEKREEDEGDSGWDRPDHRATTCSSGVRSSVHPSKWTFFKYNFFFFYNFVSLTPRDRGINGIENKFSYRVIEDKSPQSNHSESLARRRPLVRRFPFQEKHI